MNLLSIQGKYAPTFQLQDDMAIELKQNIEAITKKQVLIISSKFRSDLIYNDDQDRIDTFLKSWCNAVGYTYSNSVKQKFFRSTDEAISLSYFLYRLHLLKRIPKWYEDYFKKLMNILTLTVNADHPLCKKLYEAMDILRVAVDQHRLKGEKEILENMNNFVDLKNLVSRNQNNDN